MKPLVVLLVWQDSLAVAAAVAVVVVVVIAVVAVVVVAVVVVVVVAAATRLNFSRNMLMKILQQIRKKLLFLIFL